MISMKRWFHVGLILVATCWLATVFAGCGESNSPVSSGVAAGDGYTIKLSASQETVKNGGSVSLVAVVRGPDGKIVADESGAVQFSSSRGQVGDSSSNPAAIKDGTAQSIFTYSDNSGSEGPFPAGICTITATYRGAMASVDLIVFPKGS